MEASKNLLPKDVIFKEGEPATDLYLVKSGKVVCLKASKDRLIPVFVANAEDILGESAMTPNGVYSYSAVSLTNCEIIPVPSKDFTTVLDKAPYWLNELTTTMINRFQDTAAIIAENRVVHPAILSEEDFSSALEIEYKKLLLDN